MAQLKCSICSTVLEVTAGQETVFCNECGSTHNVAVLQRENSAALEEIKSFRKGKVSEFLTNPDKETIKECGPLLKSILETFLGTKKVFEKKANYAPLSLGPEKDKSSNYIELETLYKKAEKYKKFIRDELAARGYENIYISFVSDNSERFSTQYDLDRYKSDSEHYSKVMRDLDYPPSYRNSLEIPEIKESGSISKYILIVKIDEEGKNVPKTDRKEEVDEVTEPSFVAERKKIYISYKTKKNLKKLVAVIIIAAIAVFAFQKFGDPIKNAVEDILGKDIGEHLQIFDKNSINKEADSYYVMADGCQAINIRTGSTTKSDVITVVKSQKIKLIPTGKKTDEWIQIKIDGKTGWVHESIVKEVK